MAVTSLPIDEIVVGERLRALDPAAVAVLKESIKATKEIKTPLSVRFISLEEGWALVTGRHRLQAAIELGFKDVPVREEHGDEIDARLWEIAENLHRAELTVTERAEHIAEWVRLTEERQIQSAQLGPIENKRLDGRGHRAESGINAAARELGIERHEAQRAAKIAGLAPEAKAEARALHLDDNQTALLKAAKAQTKEEQLRALREHSAARLAPRPQPAARDPLNDFETVERQVDALMAAWNRAGPEARERFLAKVDIPVADNTIALRVVR